MERKNIHQVTIDYFHRDVLLSENLLRDSMKYNDPLTVFNLLLS